MRLPTGVTPQSGLKTANCLVDLSAPGPAVKREQIGELLRGDPTRLPEYLPILLQDPNDRAALDGLKAVKGLLRKNDIVDGVARKNTAAAVAVAPLLARFLSAHIEKSDSSPLWKPAASMFRYCSLLLSQEQVRLKDRSIALSWMQTPALLKLYESSMARGKPDLAIAATALALPLISTANAVNKVLNAYRAGLSNGVGTPRLEGAYAAFWRLVAATKWPELIPALQDANHSSLMTSAGGEVAAKVVAKLELPILPRDFCRFRDPVTPFQRTFVQALVAETGTDIPQDPKKLVSWADIDHKFFSREAALARAERMLRPGAGVASIGAAIDLLMPTIEKRGIGADCVSFLNGLRWWVCPDPNQESVFARLTKLHQTMKPWPEDESLGKTKFRRSQIPDATELTDLVGSVVGALFDEEIQVPERLWRFAAGVLNYVDLYGRPEVYTSANPVIMAGVFDELLNSKAYFLAAFVSDYVVKEMAKWVDGLRADESFDECADALEWTSRCFDRLLRLAARHQSIAEMLKGVLRADSEASDALYACATVDPSGIGAGKGRKVVLELKCVSSAMQLLASGNYESVEVGVRTLKIALKELPALKEVDADLAEDFVFTLARWLSIGSRACRPHTDEMIPVAFESEAPQLGVVLRDRIEELEVQLEGWLSAEDATMRRFAATAVATATSLPANSRDLGNLCIDRLERGDLSEEEIVVAGLQGDPDRAAPLLLGIIRDARDPKVRLAACETLIALAGRAESAAP